MTNFEKLTASPEALAALLADIPAAATPWDDAFRRQYCHSCGLEDCDHCPHEAERNNPAWWLAQEAGICKLPEGAITTEDIIVAGRKLVEVILADKRMMGMNQRELNRTMDYIRIAVNGIFTPATLQEAIDIGDRHMASAIGHQVD